MKLAVCTALVLACHALNVTAFIDRNSKGGNSKDRNSKDRNSKSGNSKDRNIPLNNFADSEVKTLSGLPNPFSKSSNDFNPIKKISEKLSAKPKFTARIQKLCSVTDDVDIILLCECGTLKTLEASPEKIALASECEELFTSTAILDVNKKVVEEMENMLMFDCENGQEGSEAYGKCELMRRCDEILSEEEPKSKDGLEVGIKVVTKTWKSRKSSMTDSFLKKKCKIEMEMMQRKKDNMRCLMLEKIDADDEDLTELELAEKIECQAKFERVDRKSKKFNKRFG